MKLRLPYMLCINNSYYMQENKKYTFFLINCEFITKFVKFFKLLHYKFIFILLHIYYLYCMNYDFSLAFPGSDENIFSILYERFFAIY